MTNPKVSVIIPVYNVELYLEECIDSVKNQTLKDIEIIVVNDGSTDNSPRILEEIQKTDDRIVIINKTNEGLSSARNAGIDVAKGEYIAFVDSDDWVSENYVKRMYDVCIKYDCDMVQCSYIDVYEGLNVIRSDKGCLEGTPTFYSGKEFSYAKHTLLSWSCSLVVNKLYKKSLFEDIRFPYGKIHEDEFTTYKVIWEADKVGLIPDELYYYRHRKGSIMNRPYRKERLDASEAYTERELFFEKKGETELSYLEKKEHLNWIFGQEESIKNMDNTIEKEYIVAYLDTKKMELTQDLERVKKKNQFKIIEGNIFPFGKVSPGSSVILYGGGNVGRQYYRQVHSQNYCDVVLWVDKNAEKCRKQGIPVDKVEEIACCQSKWDNIVIAIEDKKIICDVIKMLLEDYHIPENKIIY